MANKSKSKPNKPKASEKMKNTYSMLEGMDGNPQTPKEFDDTPGTDGEYFFNAAEDASEEEKNRCLILNYIHCRLRTNMARYVPANSAKDGTLEVMHTEEFEGAQLSVCVHYPPVAEGEKKASFAVVKLSSKDIGENGDLNGSVGEYETADAIDEEIDPSSDHRWAPRWKYVVQSLRNRMMNKFYKDGVEREDPEPEIEDNEPDSVGSQEVIEAIHEVYSGCIGQVIGPKGAKIKDIKEICNVVSIDTPKKAEDGARPKPRDLVPITIKGTQANIDKAKAMLQAIADEWRNGGPRHAPPSSPSPPSATYDSPTVESVVEEHSGWGGGGAGGDW